MVGETETKRHNMDATGHAFSGVGNELPHLLWWNARSSVER